MKINVNDNIFEDIRRHLREDEESVKMGETLFYLLKSPDRANYDMFEFYNQQYLQRGDYKQPMEYVNRLCKLEYGCNIYDIFSLVRLTNRCWGELLLLESISLANKTVNKFPQALVGLKNLKTINLRENYIGDIPYNINLLKSLEILNLTTNNVKEIPESLGDLKNLKILGLAGNDLLEKYDLTFFQRILPHCKVYL